MLDPTLDELLQSFGQALIFGTWSYNTENFSRELIIFLLFGATNVLAGNSHSLA